jgi:SAM-dependent methyltransferase
MNSLDLGCGSVPLNPFEAEDVYGVDLFEQENDNILQADLAIQSIPFPNDSFDYVTAYDFLEHVPRTLYIDGQCTYPFVNLMSAIYRVLKPGGLFYSSTPCVPYNAVFQDPTHVNFITPETFAEYFDDEKTWAKNYGFKGQFKIKLLELNPPHLIAVLEKV